MFKKIPYGVKVRVRGNDEMGFVAEYAIGCLRFFPFMEIWSVIKYKDPGKWDWSTTFPTFELAQKAAMEKYDSWISYYKSREEKEKLQKKLKKGRTIWSWP